MDSCIYLPNPLRLDEHEFNRQERIFELTFQSATDRKNNKKTKQRYNEIISLQTSFICLSIRVYVCVILSPIDFNRLWAHNENEVPEDLIAFEFAEGILRSWHFGALKVFKGAFCCCK
jgi:hypothetical protein